MFSSSLRTSSRALVARACTRQVSLSATSKSRLFNVSGVVSAQRQTRLAFSTSRALLQQEHIREDSEERYDNAEQFVGEESEEVGQQRTSRPQIISNHTPVPTIYLGNLPFEVTETDIREFFAEFPGILNVRRGMRDGRPGGFAHVQFESTENATEVMQAHASRPMEMMGRELKIDYAPPPRARTGNSGKYPPSKTLFIANIPFSADDAELEAAFASYGTMSRVHITRNRDGGSRGFAHIDFAEQGSADAVLQRAQTEPFIVSGRPVYIDYAPPVSVRAPSAKLYYRGFQGGENELRDHMSTLGISPRSMHQLKDKETEQPLAAGFIVFGTIEEATDAKERLEGANIAGQVLEVQFARAIEEDRMRNYDYRRGGGGGGNQRTPFRDFSRTR